MEKKGTKLSNQRRATWRATCRRRLAQHICETLGIQVKPSEVRLKSGEEDSRYTWRVDNPSLEPLFEKHLSKHSVGVYMQLCHEVGQSFYAIHRDSIQQSSRESFGELSTLDHLQLLKDENSVLAGELEKAEKDIEALKLAKAEAEDEVQVQKSIIREAQTTIHLHQQNIQNWMAIAEVYQMSYIRCSDALGQIIMFAQGIQSEVPVPSAE